MLAILASACQGIPPLAQQPTPTPTPAPTVTPTPSPQATAPPTATVAPEATPTPPALPTTGNNLRIGLATLPDDLLPYHRDVADQRLTDPITELLFPSPLLPRAYAYTAGGALTALPEAIVTVIPVFLDANGDLSPQPTDTTAQATQIGITCRWNPDLRWSDGTPLTASDSLFAYEMAQQQSLGTRADERLQRTADYQQIDPHTTFALLQPELLTSPQPTDPAALDLTTSDRLDACWLPLPRHAHSNDPTDPTTPPSAGQPQPLSYGAYTLATHDDERIVLHRNPYAPGAADLPADTITFVAAGDAASMYTAVATGQLDLAVNEQLAPGDLAALPTRDTTVAVTRLPGPVWEHLDFNLSFALLEQPAVRHAIAHSIDRTALARDLYAPPDLVRDNWLPPAHPLAAPAEQLTRYPYDPARAAALLAAAQLIDTDGDGFREQTIDHNSDGSFESSVPITLTLRMSSDNPIRTTIARQLQGDLAAVGLRLALLDTPTADLLRPGGVLFRREFELVTFAWLTAPDPRGYELWACDAIPAASNGWRGANVTGWCNRIADTAMQDAARALAATERTASYHTQQAAFTADLPVLPLVQRPIVVFAHPQLQGITPDPLAPITWNLPTWSLP